MIALTTYSLTTLVLPFGEGLRRVGQAEGPNWTPFVYADLIVIFLALVLSVNRMSPSLTDGVLPCLSASAGWVGLPFMVLQTIRELKMEVVIDRNSQGLRLSRSELA